MVAADYRQKARNMLGDRWTQGYWGQFAIVALVYLLIVSGLGSLSKWYIGIVGTVLVSGPLAVGIGLVSLNVVRGGKVDLPVLFEGFSDFARTLLLGVLITLFTLLWTLLLIVPGIVKAYSYSMSYFVLIDHPDFSAEDAIRESMRIMQGNKWRLFCLDCSFLGWLILSALTCGVLLVWVVPYIKTAHAAFYEEIK